MPSARTENIAVAPSVAPELTGCVTIEGGNTTAKLTLDEIVLPPVSLTTSSYAPASLAVTLVIAYEAFVAPGIGRPANCHLYDNGAVPVATAENVMGLPPTTVLGCGCTVITGAADKRSPKATAKSAIVRRRGQSRNWAAAVGKRPLQLLRG